MGTDFFVPKSGHQREKQRVLDPGCYLMIVFLCRVIKIKFYWLIAASLFFLEDKKLKKLVVALKLLTVLSLKLNVFY